MSFAPLAERLAARAAELRPAEGSRDNLAKFAALVMCALLDMLILVCEMLDAGAIADMRPVAGEQGNRVSLGKREKTPSGAGLAHGSTTSHIRVRHAVERGAKPGHDGIRTRETIARCRFPWTGQRRVILAPRRPSLFWEAPPQNAVFSLSPKHANNVTLS